MKAIEIKFIVLAFFILTCSTAYAQNKAGIKSVKEISVETKDKEVTRSFQSFDKNGNVIEEIEYDDDGRIKDHTKYEYNADHLKIKETHLTPDSKTEEVTMYEYDAKGNRISKTVMDGNGKIKSKKKYVYEYY